MILFQNLIAYSLMKLLFMWKTLAWQGAWDGLARRPSLPALGQRLPPDGQSPGGRAPQGVRP